MGFELTDLLVGEAKTILELAGVESDRPNLVLSIRSSASETLVKYKVAQDVVLLRAWCNTGTSYIGRQAWTSANEGGVIGVRPDLIYMPSGSPTVYEVGMKFLKDETIYIDCAGSSILTVVLRLQV